MTPDPDAFGYAQALAALERALVFGVHPSLDGIRALTEAMGRPQDAFASLQVTGTNGKTSTARLTRALLEGEGHSTGLYTSPHLENYTERIEVDGRPVSERDFAEAVHVALEVAERLRPGAQGAEEGFTEFELLTAAALWLFRRSGVDYAVLEVGMGGTWDSTSIVEPAVAVITGVGLDHTAVLGGTIEKIAAEKAGIIKPASAPVLGPGTAGVEQIFLERAKLSHTHPRAVRPEGALSPVDEQLTVRFLVTG
ncbi:MAG TPA: Mur ligase family protein, partial [Coriobacteriia bacterium]|nr:Mur ligase family protein [Coriobacteriia bacterium]